MSEFMKRPIATFDPAKGLLRNEHFQVCYTTNDIDRACEVFKDRFGIKEFRGLGGVTPRGGNIRIELAWVGSTMYELVTCSGPGSEMYNEMLPADHFAIKFHHLGFLIHNQQAWDTLLESIEKGGWTIRQINNNEGFMRHCYIYVPELEHHFEFIFPEQAGIDFFEGVPSAI